jgi:glutamyl-tRNA reductase
MVNSNNKNIFYIIGLSYKKADVTTRSDFSLTKENQTKLLLEARESNMDGAMVLSTCNRIELIGFAKHPYELISLLCKYSNGTVEEFAKVSYVYKNREAAEHFITIATGLDSQILGDYEIVGQLKDAFQLAKEAGTINAYLERLYNISLQASKEVKNKTSLSSGTTTVSYAAIQYIKDHIEKLSDKKILIYGLGNIGKSTAKSSVGYLHGDITLINRNEQKAVLLAEELEVKSEKHSNLAKEIHKSDVVIVATGASKPTVSVKHFDISKKQLIIDLSIPRNVHKNVKSIAGKKVIDVDVLSKKTKLTIENRKKQIPLVEQIIEKYKTDFFDWLIFRKSTPAISTLKSSLESIQKDAISLHLKKHQDLNTQHAEEITTILVNKIVTKFAMHLKDDRTQANLSIQVMEEVFK